MPACVRVCVFTWLCVAPGDEKGMLEDMWFAVRQLNNVTFHVSDFLPSARVACAWFEIETNACGNALGVHLTSWF